MDMGLDGKTIIVTGASSNIGRGILMGFAAEGANVVAAQRDSEAGQRAVDEANELGGRSICVATDVTELDSVEAMVARTMEEYGRIDVLINNAGGSPGEGKFLTNDRGDWQKNIDLNIWGVLNCIRTSVDHMIEQGEGRIINISSGSAIKGAGAVDHAVYASTKAAVNGLTRALAWEFGRYLINVNGVSPGWIVPDDPSHTSKGSFWQQYGFEYFTDERLAEYVKHFPIRRLGRPHDIAGACVYLASAHGSYVTGQILEVDGGATS